MSVLGLSGCGAKYEDARQANEQYVLLLERFVTEMQESENAQDVAAAMNRFSIGMEQLGPTMKQVMEKYPELRQKNTMPEELLELEKRADVVFAKMESAMMKIMPHMGDAEVLKAHQRMEAAMSNAGDN
jgi:hypothetical protein